MQEHWWIARWATWGGLDYEYFFMGHEQEDLTRVRMQINLFNAGIHMPQCYTLERVPNSLGELKWSYPMLVPAKKTARG